MIRILIADDHRLFLDGLRSLLEQEPDFELAGEATNGEETLRLVRETQPDVLLLDISMPKPDGMEVARKLRQDQPDVRILVLSMFDKTYMIETLIKLGVHGYILKNADKVELLEAVRTVAGGNEYFADRITRKLVRKLQRNQPTEVQLTDRECDVLRKLAVGSTTAEISEQLFISHHTVETHRKNLLSKSGTRNVVELLNWAREHEWIPDNE